MLYIGASEIFTATMIMSDGTMKAVVGGVWSGDNPSVATVDAGTGNVTIVGSGQVHIIVNSQNIQGVKLIRGLPNYQGTWSGSYVITGCSHSGYFATNNYCGKYYPMGSTGTMDFNLTQNRDVVQGTAKLFSISTTTSGSVQMGGILVLPCNYKYGDWSYDLTWTLKSTTPNIITGSLEETDYAAGWSGDIRLKADIRSLSRTSSTPMMFQGAPEFRMLNPTYEDVARARGIRR